MEMYDNDYTKEEDYMMWELHEIRNKMAKEDLSCAEINKTGKDIIDKYGLDKIKTFTVSEAGGK